MEPTTTPATPTATPPASPPPPASNGADGPQTPVSESGRAAVEKTDFGKLADEMFSEENRETEAPAAKPTVPEPKAAVMPVVAPPAAAPAPVPVVPPVVPPPVQPPPVPVAAPAEPQPAAPAPTDPLAQVAQHRSQALNFLAQKYAFDEKLEQEFMVNPGKVVPGLAAAVHVAILEDVANMVMRQLPGLVREAGKQSRSQDEAEQAFFTRWPKLKEHRKDVEQALVSYRAINPKADFETTMNQVGAIVSVQRGVFELPQSPVQVQTPPPPVSAPFVPAQPGGGTPPPMAAAPGSENPWAVLTKQFKDEGY